MSMSETPTQAEVRRCPTWMRATLIGSLALNLLVAGVIGGNIIAHGGHMDRGPGGGDVAIGAMTEALSREDRRALRQGFMEKLPGPRAFRDEQAGDTKALIALLRADQWNAAAAQAVFSGMSARLTKGLQVGQTLLLERFAAMTPAQRRAYADRLVDATDRPEH